MEKILFLILIITIVLIMESGCSSKSKPAAGPSEKINGVNFVAPSDSIGAAAMQPIRKVNANWVTLMPFAFGRSGSANLRYNLSRQWWGERKEGVRWTIKYAHELGLKVMIKPHVWVMGGGWRGNFKLRDEKEWQKWEQEYHQFIMGYAQIADSLDADLFCLGTELRISVRQRPTFWKQLIQDVRKVYNGRITYAANWDNYRQVSFWDELDYIGIDAYFSLSSKAGPPTSLLKKKWQPIKRKLGKFAQNHNKRILFTEFGYRSVNYTADGHWKYNRQERSVNMQAQADSYHALFETFWNEPWFAGGFLWKWHDNHPKRGGSDNTRYTPQNKPAEKVVRDWYGR